MSDSTNNGQTVTTESSPTGDGGQATQPGGAQPQQGDANPTPQAGDQQSNESGPFATFPDADSFNRRMQREADKRMTEAVKAAGFESWEQMNERLTAIQNAVNPQPAQSATPEPAATGGTDLSMALQVAQEKGLPVALVQRLQGSTKEEMAADADALLALVGPSAPAHQPPSGPGVPSAPSSDNQAVTFTRSQLQDAAFVRDNKDAIMQAAREGRIVES